MFSFQFVMKRGKSLLFILSFLVLAPDACLEHGASTVVRQSKIFAAHLDSLATHKAGTTANPLEAPEGRIYLDASISMQGYVVPDTNTAYKQFINGLGYALHSPRVIKFGQPHGVRQEDYEKLTQQVDLDKTLFSPSFYNLEYNPSHVLVQHLNTEHRPALSVLITDGVHSDQREREHHLTVEAILHWLEQGGTFGILALKARFSTREFYSERLRAMVPWGGTVAARPVYAFVFSPTTQDFNDLEAELRRRFPSLQTLWFSDEAIRSTVSTPLQQGAKCLDWTIPPRAPYYWHMCTPAGALTYTIEHSIAASYPVRRVALKGHATYYRWDRDHEHFEASPTSPSSSHYRCTVNTNQGTTQIALQIANREDYGFYRIQLKASVGLLREEVLALSTDDDSKPAELHKTYKFQVLINALADGHLNTRLARTALPRLYLTTW